MRLPLETRALRLRQFVPADARDLFRLSNEEVFRAGLPSQVYRDEAHGRATLEFLIDRYSNPGNPKHGPYVLAIEHKGVGALIGHVGFSPFDDEVEIGFAIAQAYQRRGLATEAIVAASRWAFETFELERIIAIASAKNLASKGALARAQFVLQGDRMMPFQGAEQAVSVYWLSAPPRGAGA